MASAALQTTSAQQRSVDITARLHELVYDLSGVGLSTLSLSPGTRRPNETLTSALNAAITVVSSAHSMLGWLRQTRNSLEASIYRLPDEVLRQIIREADGKSKNYGLRLVSARWRDLVDCMPAYWTTIRPSKMKMEFQRLCLNRSTSWPLHLELKHPISSNEPSLAHARRWKSLDLVMDFSYGNTSLLVPCPLPSLEFLHLTKLGEPLDPSNIKLIDDDLPRFTHTHLVNVHPPLLGETALARLHSLSLIVMKRPRGFSPTDLLDMFGSCPQLRHLALKLYKSEEQLPHSRINTVGLPQLTKLEFLDGCAPSWFSLVDCVTFPDSVSIAAEVWGNEWPGNSASIAALVTRVKERVYNIVLNVVVERWTAYLQYEFRSSGGETLLNLKIKDTGAVPGRAVIESLFEKMPVRHVIIGSKACAHGISLGCAEMISDNHPDIQYITLYVDALTNFDWISDHEGGEWLFLNLTGLHIANATERDVWRYDLFNCIVERVKGASSAGAEALDSLTVVGLKFDPMEERELKEMVPNLCFR